jgi:hypothetical protein
MSAQFYLKRIENDVQIPTNIENNNDKVTKERKNIKLTETHSKNISRGRVAWSGFVRMSRFLLVRICPYVAIPASTAPQTEVMLTEEYGRFFLAFTDLVVFFDTQRREILFLYLPILFDNVSHPGLIKCYIIHDYSGGNL